MTILKELQISLAEVREGRANLRAHSTYESTFRYDEQERALLNQYERCVAASPLSPGDIIILSDVMKQYEARVARIATFLEQNKPNNDMSNTLKALEIRQKGLMWLVLITHFIILIAFTFLILGYL
jgi:hypothetical protein